MDCEIFYAIKFVSPCGHYVCNMSNDINFKVDIRKSIQSMEHINLIYFYFHFEANLLILLNTMNRSIDITKVRNIETHKRYVAYLTR